MVMFTAKDRAEQGDILDAVSRLVLAVAELNEKVKGLDAKLDEALDNPVDEMQAGIDAIMSFTGAPKGVSK